MVLHNSPCRLTFAGEGNGGQPCGRFVAPRWLLERQTGGSARQGTGSGTDDAGRQTNTPESTRHPRMLWD